MSDAPLADAIARLDQHHELHLPLRRGDLLGRLALRVLWKRQVKWQVETNLAARDAVRELSGSLQQLRADVSDLRAHPASGGDAVVKQDLDHAVERLNAELDALRRGDQNIMAGLNQRFYALIGGVRTELSDLRLALAEKAEGNLELETRLRTLESAVAELNATARDARLRHAQLDLFLDRARTVDPTETGTETGGSNGAASVAAAIPPRSAFLELAVAELLDGPTDQVRARRSAYLPTIKAARANGASGEVFDLAPGRGEWFEALRADGVPYLAASTNPLVVRQCAELGCTLRETDPLELLAATPKRSLGAVTAFRFVERLDPDLLARFVDLAAAAIQPGGALIIESPHTGGPAAKDFHLDPFAVRPVHPQFLRFLAEAAGFAGVEVRFPDAGPFAGWPEDITASEDERADRYCLIAWR